jgi:hypothetical protein
MTYQVSVFESMILMCKNKMYLCKEIETYDHVKLFNKNMENEENPVSN